MIITIGIIFFLVGILALRISCNIPSKQQQSKGTVLLKYGGKITLMTGIFLIFFKLFLLLITIATYLIVKVLTVVVVGIMILIVANFVKDQIHIIVEKWR